ncbi:MAG: hypothetical protein ACQEP1_01455 [Nanobdellota archaeon]
MALDGFTIQMISVGVVLFLFALHIFSKKVHYFVGGLILMGLGVLKYLVARNYFHFQLWKFPVIEFALWFLAVFAGKDLLKEGFSEDSKVLKWPSIIIALTIIVLTTVPTLNSMGIIEFALPSYPPIIDHVIYVLTGIFLLIGTFTLVDE